MQLKLISLAAIYYVRDKKAFPLTEICFIKLKNNLFSYFYQISPNYHDVSIGFRRIREIRESFPVEGKFYDTLHGT